VIRLKATVGRPACISLLAAGLVIQGPHIQAQPGAAPAQVEKIYRVKHVQLERVEGNSQQLMISAVGEVRTAGWGSPSLRPRAYNVPPEDGIQEFDFVAEPPGGPAAQVITTVSARFRMEKVSSWLKGVRVHSSSNFEEAAIGKAAAPKMDRYLPRE